MSRGALVEDESDDGSPDVALLRGQRVHVRAGEITPSAPNPRLVGLYAVPARLGGGYVFGPTRARLASPSFDGPLTAVAEVAAIGGAAPLRDRVVLRTPAGALELEPRTRAVRRAEEPGLAAAASSKDGAVSVTLDALGRARVRLGAAAPIDLTARTGERFYPRDRRRRDQADERARRRAVRRRKRMRASRGPTAHACASRSIHRRRRGARARPTPRHRALADAIVRRRRDRAGHRARLHARRQLAVARVSLRSGQTIDEHPTRAPLDATCALLRLDDELVAACPGGAHASVFSHLDGEPELEIAFDARASFVLGAGAAIGFEGPCDRASADGTSTPRAPRRDGAAHVYCARQPGGAWVERAITGADGEHFLRWIPAPGGHVTALVAAHDGALPSDPGVRKIRVAKTELSLAPRIARTIGVDRDAWEEPGGAVRVWSRAPDDRRVGVRVDASGAVNRPPTPQESQVLVDGPRALAWSRAPDGGVFESTDGGATFREIEAPLPAAPEPPMDTDGVEPGCVRRVGARRVGSGARVARRARRFLGGAAAAPLVESSTVQLAVTVAAWRDEAAASPRVGARRRSPRVHGPHDAKRAGVRTLDVRFRHAVRARRARARDHVRARRGEGRDVDGTVPQRGRRRPAVRVADCRGAGGRAHCSASRGAEPRVERPRSRPRRHGAVRRDAAILRVARGAASAASTASRRSASSASARRTLARRLDRPSRSSATAASRA